MKIEKTEVLHETRLVIAGHEPFLRFGSTSLIVNLHDQSGQSHNFFQGPVAGIPFHVRNGDTLRFELVRVRTVEVPWYYKIQKVWERIWDDYQSF